MMREPIETFASTGSLILVYDSVRSAYLLLYFLLGKLFICLLILCNQAFGNFKDNSISCLLLVFNSNKFHKSHLSSFDYGAVQISKHYNKSAEVSFLTPNI